MGKDRWLHTDLEQMLGQQALLPHAYWSDVMVAALRVEAGLEGRVM